MATDDEREEGLILRENSQVVGITRGKKKPVVQPRKFSTAVSGDEPADAAAIRKIAEALITADGHNITEEEALARAAELASEAGQRFKMRTPTRKAGVGLGAVLSALVNRKKNSGG